MKKVNDYIKDKIKKDPEFALRSLQIKQLQFAGFYRNLFSSGDQV